MVAGIVLGDLAAAVVEWLRADPDLDALVHGRISIAFPEGNRAWSMPDFAIIVRPSGGRPPSTSDQRRWGRVDVNFFGQGKTPNIRRRTARQLWRTSDPILFPPPNRGIPSSYKSSAGITIYNVQPDMSEPFAPAVEPGTDWERVIMPYTLQYASIP